MLFSWWKRRRRKRITAEPFPAAWDETLASIPHVPVLVGDERGPLRQAVQIFLAEKTFEGCAGFEVTDEVRVTVAGLASLLTLGLPGVHFDQVPTVLVHPDAFTVQDRVEIAPELDLEGESESGGLGEAH